MSSAVARAPKPGLFQVIDWRLVAAIGLPVWAFLFGVVLMHRSAPAVPAPAEPTPTAAATPQPPPAPAPVEPIPAPRAAVTRTEFQPVPIVVPIPAPAAPPVQPTPAQPVVALPAVAPVEFKLPPSEVMPADRCKTFETRIRFHPDLTVAAEEAKTSKKMLLVLHISGNFDDPGFT